MVFNYKYKWPYSVLLLTLATPLTGYAGSMDFTDFPVNGQLNVPVVSYAERRFQTVYKQQFDFSCGSAALASLLRFHYDDAVDEQAVFIDMYNNGDKAKIQKQGFSLLDMKQYLQRRGYQATGYKMALDDIAKAQSPAITIINNKSYLHFVLIKGLTAEEVLIGDPAQGVKVIPRADFEAMWDKQILFFIVDRQPNNPFQAAIEWSVRTRAPLPQAVDPDSLAAFNLLQPGRWDF
jgi:predicted double-glycine peptidase